MLFVLSSGLIFHRMCIAHEFPHHTIYKILNIKFILLDSNNYLHLSRKSGATGADYINANFIDVSHNCLDRLHSVFLVMRTSLGLL